MVCLSVPDPPTDLRAINVTDGKALLLWRPALATVDHYVIVYSSDAGERSLQLFKLQSLKCSISNTLECCFCTGNLRWHICSVVLECDLYSVRKERTDTLSNIPEKLHSCVFPLISTWAWNQHQSVWQCCRRAAADAAVLHTVQSKRSQPAGRPEQLQSHHSLHYIQR